MKALLDGNLSTQDGIHRCVDAAEALQKCMDSKIHPSLEKMAAVQDQRKRFEKLKSTFAKRLSHHLNNLFIHQVKYIIFHFFAHNVPRVYFTFRN